MPEINYNESTKMKGAPKITKIGVVSPNGEMSPFVWKGRLMRLELIDSTKGLDMSDSSICATIRDVATGEKLSFFGQDCYYFSGYLEDDTYYVSAVVRSSPDTYKLFWSKDLLHWNERVLLSSPGFKYYNSSICKGPDGYVIVMEASEPKQYVGDHPFTCFFAISKDLYNWKQMPYEYAYPKDRYIGGPFLRYCDGFYYLICVEALPCNRYTNYLYRTNDFITWEIGYYNPLLMPSEEDRLIAPHAIDLGDELLAQIPTGFISSNSDIDMCEFEGKTILNYAVGNQLGYYYMAEAVYNGPMDVFLKSFFE